MTSPLVAPRRCVGREIRCRHLLVGTKQEDRIPSRSPSGHPTFSFGEMRRVVIVAVKAVDRVSTHAGEYAKRIPAASHRGIHASCGSGCDVAAEWRVTMPGLPLDVVTGADVVTAIEAAVRQEIANPAVREVVVVLARRRSSYEPGTTLRRLVRSLREIHGVAPIVLPPPPSDLLRTR